MQFRYNDGGRVAAGFKGDTAGDCAVRAICNATGADYLTTYNAINMLAERERPATRKLKRGKERKRSNSREGVWKPTFSRYMESIGWIWHPTMTIGAGCKVHMRADELPPGRIIVSLTRHYSAVIDGVNVDTYDCSRDGSRCVYGYWTAP